MPVQIDTDELIQAANNSGYGQQHIIETATGIIYAVQINSSNVIEVKVSSDGGSNWSEDTTFSGLSAPFCMSFCKSELDDIFLCYCHNNTTYVVNKRDHTSGTWSQVANGTLDLLGCQAMICYSRFTPRLYIMITANAAPYFLMRYSDDYGSSFTTVNIGGPGSGAKAIYGVDTHPITGNIYTVIKAAAGGTSGYVTWICSALGTGLASEGALTVSSAPAGQLGGALALDSAGNRWRLIYYLLSGNYRLRVDKNGSSSFDTSYSTTDTLNHGQLAIGIDNKDNVYIFYVKTADSICYYQKYDAVAATWGAETPLSVAVGVRPSCVQIVKSGGTKLRILYTADA